jgi:hypothetical protein
MTLQEAIDILDAHQKWRRDLTDEHPATDPKTLGIAIDTILNHFQSNPPK